MGSKKHYLKKTFLEFLNERKEIGELYTNKNVNIGDVYEESDIYKYVQELHYKRDYDFLGRRLRG